MDPHPGRWPWDDVPDADDDGADEQAGPAMPDAFSETPGSDDSVASSVKAPDFDSAARRELIGKLANLKQTARRQNNGTTLYLHITDETLLAGEGVARVEGFGPVLVTRLEELIGHHHITLKPVIDLKDKLAVDSYEIPQRIRERIKLRYPAEQFIYGTGESSHATDLDHIKPFKPNGPPKQTNTDNLIPLRRFSHRVKTHGGWQVHRLNDDALEWTTRHGFKFIVDHRGTRPADRQ
ncbi:HNH endonuclease [Streptomyces sp. SID13031]|nr:HNH endonuclease [Streptomyces sp. SID13031]